MSGENEFIDWQGGKCPVDPDTIVQVRLSGNDGYFIRRAGDLRWCHTNYSGDIIAYRVIEAQKPQVQIPEGFTSWLGGACPVAASTRVDVVLRDDSTGPCTAGALKWSHLQHKGDIVAYRVIEAAKPKVEIPEGFTPWSGGKKPVDREVYVEAILRDGRRPAMLSALGARWLHNGDGDDIIAYRVIEDDKPKTARDTQVGGDHYKTAGVQPWDVVDTWPIEQQIGFHRGNALKYVMRMGTKDENLREIRKAAHYLQKLAEVLEQKGGV